MKHHHLWLLVLLIPACGEPAGDDDDTAVVDDDDDTAVVDDDDDDTATNEIANDWGFTMRLPRSHELDCGSGDIVEFTDSDWLCSWGWEGEQGMAYVQTTPVDCYGETFDTLAVYAGGRAELALGDEVVALTDAAYDWGGNHHNDELSFAYEGRRYRYYHSSFGWGWRSCNPMDCVVVSDLADNSLIQDGCTCDRELPVVCHQVGADGHWDALVDTFAVCDGDSACGG